MGMGWQEPVALSIVLVTAVILLWGRFRPRKVGFGSHGSCGCSGSSAASRPSVIYRARKGERPEVEYKMK